MVKADAYGLGMAAVAPALARAGCKTFFVATLGEAEELRGLLAGATIYVLAGLQRDTAPVYRRLDLRPVLNSADEIEEWATFSKSARANLPAAIHIDSGMNRLGLSAAEVEAVAGTKSSWNAFELALVMSHLACSDEPEHGKNEVQRKTFDALRAKLPKAAASLANSAGILLGRAYHYDLVRPGIALYGGKASRAAAGRFARVVQLAGQALQVRDVQPGETVAYRATGPLDEKPKRTEDPRELARRGAWVELIGTHVAAHEFAAHAGTIDYEVLTNLGTRAARRYTGG